jgi:hypothetical protein
MDKARQPKRQLSDAELRSHLAEQVGFLETSAAAFDAGKTGEAKRLALTIRVLLHDTRHSKSLLKQLNLDIPFISTCSLFEPKNLSAHIGLLTMQMDSSGLRYVPKLADPRTRTGLSFEEWWNEIVFTDDGNHNRISRKDLILTVANQDGGGHVDPGIDGVYDNFVRDNPLGWTLVRGGNSEPMSDPTKIAIRQIAFEVISVLKPHILS